MVPPGTKLVASNRRARRAYEILDTIECGIVLRGSEVKSLRESRVTLADAYGRVDKGELWLVGMHITPYSHASTHEELDAERRRKLLVHRSELRRLKARVDREGVSLVPLALYFKNGKAKIELAVAKGRRRADRRAVIARRDADLEARRALRQRTRGE